jgi:hypothetical protein
MEATVKQASHETEESAKTAVDLALGNAYETGKWMVAVWSVEDNGKTQVTTLQRTTWKFPGGEDNYQKVMAQLSGHMHWELEGKKMLPDAPLPEAQIEPTGVVEGDL